MTISIQECPKCGGKLKVSTGQSIQFGELVWFRSCRCESCNFATEEDGSERDDDIRNELLQTEGTSILQVDLPEDRSRALVETKQALGLGMSDIARLRQIDVGCVAAGTKVEMEWLRQRLEAKGINARATILSPAS